MSLLLPRRMFELEAAMGTFPAYYTKDVFGYNPSVAAGAVNEIWESASRFLYYPNSAYGLQLVSGSTSDTVSGTGAQIVHVYGLDANFGYQYEAVTMSGTSVVSLQNKYTRVYKTKVERAGTSDANVGVITLSCNEGPRSGGTVSLITSGNGASFLAQFTTPSGYWGFLQDVAYSSAKSDEVCFCSRVRVIPTGGFHLVRKTGVFQNTYNEKLDWKIPIPPKSDFKVTINNLGSQGVEVSANFRMLIVDQIFVNSQHLHAIGA